MQVKNYIVENLSLFMDYLERELCQQGISYVKIDNEIHFQNQIIRLYDFKRNYDEMIKWFIMNKLQEPSQEKGVSLDNLLIIIPEEDFDKERAEELMNYITNMKVKPISEISELSEFFIERKKCYPKRNHSTLKRESIEVNQKLKRYNRKRKI